ncbi:Hypothetical protein CINCED_3A006926 [Cinara cedri]|uniref:Uncharacterized protein n=1 Tax=Cinara cedri TaxID=506608 RepID=A0A5E4N4S1_9HEMI|nr:Hypothetical protein CINCED_3A006926 [Cinara cedri]
MEINVKKFIIIVVYVIGLAVGFFLYINYLQVPTQTLVDDVSEKIAGLMFPNYEKNQKLQLWRADSSSKDDDLFLNNCDDINDALAEDWWIFDNNVMIILISSMIPFVVFYTMQWFNGQPANVPENLDWSESLGQREAMYANNRRLTLPDLTLARHARRESLAENAQNMPNRPRKMYQCVSKFRKMRKNSFERNDDSVGETKRAHIIRRRH